MLLDCNTVSKGPLFLHISTAQQNFLATGLPRHPTLEIHLYLHTYPSLALPLNMYFVMYSDVVCV